MSSQPTRRAFLQRAAAVTLAAGGAAPALFAADQPAPFRLAICNETFGDWPFDKACRAAAEFGYAGIEIAPFTLAKYVTDIPAPRRAEIRRQAEQAQLQVVGLHWILAKTEGLHLTTPDAAVRRKTADYLIALAHFCGDVGGKVLVLGSPQQRNLLPGVSQDEAMQRAAEVLRAAVPTLEKTGVVIALEPLAPAATNFLTTADEAAKLIGMVDSPCCRLQLDCRAMSSEATPIPELIRRHRGLLAHFHANDSNGQGPGFGQLDFVPIVQTLRAIDYRGWVSVEVFDYKPGGERLARESIRYLRECLGKGNGS